MENFQLPSHFVQSPEWAEFKTKMGTKAVRVGEVWFTLHKIPLTPLNIGYCPKADPERIDWSKLKRVVKKNNCVVVRFDVPNVLKWEVGPSFATHFAKATRVKKATAGRGGKWEKIFEKHCREAPQDTFAKQTILLDLTKSEKELLKNMKPKTRYNIRLAQKHGIEVKERDDPEALEIFLRLQRETANREGFYIHPDTYYKTMWQVLRPKKMIHLLIAEFEGEPLVAWILFTYKNVLYYPYGGSSVQHRERMPSNLICWEAICLGKQLGCEIFDMWGAASDENDPWYGFTRFKLGFGGELVTFIDSYDLVIKPVPYYLFNLANDLRWRYLNLRAAAT